MRAAAFFFLHYGSCVVCVQRIALIDNTVAIFYSLCHDISDGVSHQFSYAQRVSHSERVVQDVYALYCCRRS